MGSEQNILLGNKLGSPIEAIGTCILTLSSDFIFKLEKNFYVLSFSRNLISFSILMIFGYSFNFKDMSLFYNSKCVGNDILSYGLYLLGLQTDATYSSIHGQTGIKKCNINENSSMLWHRRLEHISIESIKRLVKYEALNTLEFADFNTCVGCIKGKQTNMSKKGANRSLSILEIIHTDIYCPNMDSCGQKYFITFIDDYS